MRITVRSLRPPDWDAVARVYREGIATGDATFETQVPRWEAWDTEHLPDCRLVALASTATERSAPGADRAAPRSGRVVGFAALSAVSRRPVYRGVAEVMVYVAEEYRGRRVGRRLLTALVRCSERAGIWTLEAGIFPENEASVALHEAVGFRIVGRQERIGRAADGRWRDVLLLQRRSPTVGTG